MESLVEGVSEWIDRQFGLLDGILVDLASGKILSDTQAMRRCRVERALADGRDVPPAILVQFPDLLARLGC